MLYVHLIYKLKVESAFFHTLPHDVLNNAVPDD